MFFHEMDLQAAGATLQGEPKGQGMMKMAFVF
jgi:hypothetical protein